LNPVRYFQFYDNSDDHDDRLSDECKSSTYNVAGTIVSGRGVVLESTSVFFPPLCGATVATGIHIVIVIVIVIII
jgi:hypothetical protein